MRIDSQEEPFLTISKIAKKRDEEFFLVGGFIRDRLLEKASKDIDFAIAKDPIGFAREVSHKLNGAFVLLDKHCGRVVLKDLTLDFTKLEGNLEDDIKRRDFTINSLAMKGPDFKEIIDLVAGFSDLSKKTIRMVSKEGLLEDPLRLLRAIRFSSSLNFEIEKETISAIKENASFIRKSAPERITYELFEILKNKNSDKFLKLSFELGLLSEIIPEIIPLSNIKGRGYHHLNLLEHSFETVRQIEMIADNFLFKEYKAYLQEYLNEEIASDHTRLSLLKLIGLLHDLGKPETIKEEEGRLRFIGHEKLGEDYVKNIGKRLKFSQDEIFCLRRVVLNHMRPGTLIQGGIITKKAIFRLSKDLSSDLIMLLILSLADRYSAIGKSTTIEDIKNHEGGIKKILDFIFSEKEPIKPPKIVSGDEIMERFGLEESPLIGKLLSLIEEAWIEGRIKDKEDAFKVVERAILQNN